MFKGFIGKNVEMILGFSTYIIDGGAVPSVFYGTVLEVDENSIKMSLIHQDKGMFGTIKYNNEIMEVNIKYVISLREVL